MWDRKTKKANKGGDMFLHRRGGLSWVYIVVTFYTDLWSNLYICIWLKKLYGLIQPHLNYE